MEAGLEGNSLVKSIRYLIVIFFQGGIFRPNRPVLKLNDSLLVGYTATNTGKGKKAQWLSVLLGDSKKNS